MSDASTSWSLRNKVCIVTGATSGIGEATAIGLAREGAELGLVARNPERGQATVERILRATGNEQVELFQADLASQKQVREVSEEILLRYPQIHVLVNNAGIVQLGRTTTVDGLEATFAVNHLAPFLLTNLLLERLIASAPARVITVASDAHKFGKLDLDDLQNERRYRSMRVYGQSKGANLLFTRELARRLEGTGVVAHAVHPGAVSTRLAHQNGFWAQLLSRALGLFFLTPEQGADTTLHLATDPEMGRSTGRYWYKRREHTASSQVQDPETARRLWEESERLTGMAGG